MNLQRHMTEIFLIDTDTDTEYKVKYIDFEMPADGCSVIIQRKTLKAHGMRPELWATIQATETTKTPGFISAMMLLKKAIQ